MNTYSSYYIIGFKDGTFKTSKQVRWLEHARKIEAIRQGKKKFVYASSPDILSLEVCHDGMSKKIELAEGQSVFQSIVAEHIYSANSEGQDKILGRIIGIVAEGEILEEYFLDGERNEVIGYRYNQDAN